MLHSFVRQLKHHHVVAVSFPLGLIKEVALVLSAIEPSQFRLLHCLAIAHVREFVAEKVDGQLSLANAARSFQDQ